MASINSLNHQTLYKIFLFFSSHYSTTLVQWRLKLPLLHVCTKWTEVARPLVLREGYIEIIFKKTGVVRKLLHRRPRVLTNSNTHILIARQYNDYVEHILVKAYNTRDYSAFFDTVLQELEADTVEWARVKKLLINMSAETKDMYFVDKEELVVPPKHVCEAYGERLYRCMKGIQHLEIQEPLISESYVASGLVEKYLGQLCYLRCSNPLAVTEKYFANTLTYLHLSMNPNSTVCFLPQLSAQPLEALVLSNIPRNFTWMEFYDVKGRDVVFENLKSLALSFQRENKDNAKLDQRVPCYRLHFPRLSNLTIRNCPKNSELYFCQAYFKQLERVKVWGSVDSLDAMKALGLKKASSFDVVVVDDNDSDDKRHKKVYELVGHYLRSVISPAKRLFVHANLGCIEYQPMDWSNLCFLALYDMVKFDQLLSFINGIPSLLSLYVLRASFEGILPGDSAVADDTDQESDSSDDATLADRLLSLFPSSTLTLATENTEVVNSAGIKEFSLYFDEQPGYSDKFKAHVARYMAESLPSLQHLYVEPSLQYHLTKKNRETRTAVYKQQAQFSIRYAEHWMHRAYVTNLISL